MAKVIRGHHTTDDQKSLVIKVSWVQHAHMKNYIAIVRQTLIDWQDWKTSHFIHIPRYKAALIWLPCWVQPAVGKSPPKPCSSSSESPSDSPDPSLDEVLTVVVAVVLAAVVAVVSELLMSRLWGEHSDAKVCLFCSFVRILATLTKLSAPFSDKTWHRMLLPWFEVVWLRILIFSASVSSPWLQNSSETVLMLASGFTRWK